jgi:hypothetical protein
MHRGAMSRGAMSRGAMSRGAMSRGAMSRGAMSTLEMSIPWMHSGAAQSSGDGAQMEQERNLLLAEHNRNDSAPHEANIHPTDPPGRASSLFFREGCKRRSPVSATSIRRIRGNGKESCGLFRYLPFNSGHFSWHFALSVLGCTPLHPPLFALWHSGAFVPTAHSPFAS